MFLEQYFFIPSCIHNMLTRMMTQQDPNNYWEQLERLEKLIRASELKAGVIFSFHSLILGLFVDRLDFFKPLLTGNVVVYCFNQSLALVCFNIGLFIVLSALFPRWN